MFEIFKAGTKRQILKNHTFFSYERARQALRKYIRAQVAKGKLVKEQFGMWDSISRNPGRFSSMFTIRKVAE